MLVTVLTLYLASLIIVSVSSIRGDLLPPGGGIKFNYHLMIIKVLDPHETRKYLVLAKLEV